MSSQSSNYTLLVEKLDQFIRKFYINKLIRGTLYTVALVLGVFLIFNLLEHQFYFDKGVRKGLFSTFLVVFIGSFGYWVLYPLAKYFSLGKTISHKQAAEIIGGHFGDVKDKLLNILQLKELSKNVADASLIEASVNQKTEAIRLVPFSSAIDLKKNRKYLRYALPPFLILAAIMLAAPSLIKESTNRIINNNLDFEKAAPFQFILQDDLSVVQYEDHTINIKIEGEALPEKVFIKQDGFDYNLTKVSPDLFTYTFKNVQKDLDFALFSGKVVSQDYTLDVLEKPTIGDLNINLDFPNYIGRTDENIENIGDLSVPAGTKIRWQLQTVNTDAAKISFKGKDIDFDKKSRNEFAYSKTAKQSESYKIFISNTLIDTPDSLIYSLTVQPDQYPQISVEEYQDSISENLFYFIGNANDDYGINSLAFHYTVLESNGREKEKEIIKLSDKTDRNTSFDYVFDINTLGLKPGENVKYYFEVFDNDGFNGSKSAKTGVRSFRKMTMEEFEEKEDKNEEEIKKILEKSLDKVDDIKKEFKELREKLLQEKKLDWQNKEDIEKLLEEQKKLQDELKKAKEKFEENMKNQEEFSEQKEEIREKQEKLQEMFEEVLDNETKELMEKIEELMQELNKENALEMMEDFEMNDETLEKEMDRLLELYKQLEMEKELEEQIEKLNELAEKQEKLSEETKKEEKPNEELQKEQEKLNEEFEKLKEKQEELEKKNDELSPPKDMGDKEENEEQMEEISEDMEQSSEDLEKQDSEKASESQQNAADKMKQMAASMQASMESGEMEQMEEDMQALRQLLENLVGMSFDQEALVEDILETGTVSPRYVDLVQNQFKLNDDFKLIEDSLQALALRVSQIESFVSEKVADTKQSLAASLELLEDREKAKIERNGRLHYDPNGELLAIAEQRKTMRYLNDLALMLSESMNQMQQAMSACMSGSQNCSKPGNNPNGKSGKKGNVPMDKISEGQESLQKDLEGMKKQMEKGKGGSSKEFAQAAARQAALRKALKDLQREKQEQGKADSALQGIIDQMDKIETDLVNKRLDGELLKRQQDILTRLLEAEKAERQREYDNKRKSESGKDKKRELPPSLQEYLKKREAEISQYKSVSPELRPYYRSLVDKYYKELRENR